MGKKTLDITFTLRLTLLLRVSIQARIEAAGGFVSPPPEPGLSSRVWLDAAMTQIGLAMARSIGDHAVKSIGVVAEPEITTHTIAVRERRRGNAAAKNMLPKRPERKNAH